MKPNIKLKDLLLNRDKLRKYDELKQWVGYFIENGVSLYVPSLTVLDYDGTIAFGTFHIPDSIRKIIVDALEAEIAKLDEE